MAESYIQIGMADYGDETWAPDYVETEKLIARDHGFLFDFLDYDFTEVERIFHQYLSCLDDGSEPDTELLLRVISGLQKAHPYFRECQSNASWVINRIMAGYIMQRFKDAGTEAQRTLFNKVSIKRHSVYADAAHIFEYPVRPDEGHILSPLTGIQKDIRRWVFMVIDDTNPELAQCSIERRAALYGYLFGSTDSGFSIKTEIRPMTNKQMKEMEAHYEFKRLNDAAAEKLAGRTEGTMEFDDDEDEADDELWDDIPNGSRIKPPNKNSKMIAEIVSAKRDRTLYEPARDDMDALMELYPKGKLPTSIERMLGATIGITDSGRIVHIIESFPALLEFEVHGMVNAGTHVIRCWNCGRYFVPKKDKDAFCDRPVEGTDKNCYAMGLEYGFGDAKELKKFLSREYHDAYNAHQQKVRRGTMSEEDFKGWWVPEAKGKRPLVMNGRLTIKEYVEWLHI